MEMGIRSYRAVFNVPGDRVGELVAAYRAALDGGLAAARGPRALVGQEFTRGHFAKAV
jgi:hypothetical protein